jgi:filamentous hemagglutinin family protein
MNIFSPQQLIPTAVRLITLIVCLLMSVFPLANAQVTTAITPTQGIGNLGTQVGGATTLANGKLNYDITGGTRPNGGTNLFHSFGQFSMAANNIANFLNDTGLATKNILSRVTGGNPSNIFGTLQTTGFGNANLYLMNPAGVVFGPTASLNVGGSFHVTTADYLRLADNVRFTALPSAQDALLTTAPVAAFGFLGPTPGQQLPYPAGISIQESVLEVPTGQTLSLIGGDITVAAATVTASSGGIQLASVASPSEVIPNSAGALRSLDTSGFAQLGLIALSQQAFLTTSGNPGGTVVIRGDRLVADNSSIFASSTGSSTGTPSIDVQLARNLVLTTGTLVSADTLGVGNAPAVVTLSADLLDIGTSVIRASTSGTGSAGAIALHGREIDITGGGQISTSAVSGSTGKAGSITISASEKLMLSGRSSTGTQSGLLSDTSGSGNAGQIIITTPTVQMTDALIAARANSGSTGEGGFVTANVGTLSAMGGAFFSTTTFGTRAGGTINLTATESISISGRNTSGAQSGLFSSTNRNGDAGQITIAAPLLQINDGLIETRTGTGSTGRAGTITVNLGTLSLTGGAQMSATTFGTGAAGTVALTATESIALSGRNAGGTQSQVISNAFSSGQAGQVVLSAPAVTMSDALIQASTGTGSTGQAGMITANVGTLSVTGGASMSATTFGTGAAGTVAFTATESIALSGRNSAGTQSGVFSSSSGTPAGGLVAISAPAVMVNDAVIQARSSGVGAGGQITITATDTVEVVNKGIISVTSGTGQGGTIDLHAGKLTVATNALIDASGSGGGKLIITADHLRVDHSNMFADASGAVTSAGTSIDIRVNEDAVLTNGAFVTADVLGKASTGAIKVTAKSLEVSDSAVLASRAFSNSTGNPSNIEITADTVLVSNDGRIQTRTRNGTSGGNIAITSPTVNISGGEIDASSRGTATGGNITVNTDVLVLEHAALISSESQGFSRPGVIPGAGGTITVQGVQGEGSRAQAVVLKDVSVISTTTEDTGTGGTVTINTGSLTLTGAGVDSSTFGPGRGGDININATGDIKLSAGGFLFSEETTGTGTPGNVTVQANNITASDGAISTDTFGPGRGGTISISATNSMSLSEAFSITSSSLGREIGTGNAGDIIVSARVLSLSDGSQMTTKTSGPGQGGNLTVTASEAVNLSNGALISSTSDGLGNAGNINITATDSFIARNGIITTQGLSSDGGNITFHVGSLLHLINSDITTSVGTGAGNGGNITIDPQFFIVDHSRIVAKAFGGNGGNINITAGVFLADPSSILSASSALGVNGTIQIQSPVQNLSGSLSPLPSSLLKIAPLTSACAARAQGGSFSSFTVAGRDGVPAEPGGLLPSPLPQASLALGSGQQAATYSDPGLPIPLLLSMHSEGRCG